MWPSVWIRYDKGDRILAEHCQTGWEYVYNTKSYKIKLQGWQRKCHTTEKTGNAIKSHTANIQIYCMIGFTWNTIRTTSGLLSCGSYHFHLCLVLGTRAKVCIVMKLLFIWIICKTTLSQESTTGHMCNLVFSKNYIIKNETKEVN